MRCKNCNNKVKRSNVYCPQCGETIKPTKRKNLSDVFARISYAISTGLFHTTLLLILIASARTALYFVNGILTTREYISQFIVINSVFHLDPLKLVREAFTHYLPLTLCHLGFILAAIFFGYLAKPAKVLRRKARVGLRRGYTTLIVSGMALLSPLYLKIAISSFFAIFNAITMGLNMLF